MVMNYRLLSQKGIPKLRRTAKDRLRLKGKGHELSDAERLLSFYQLWLDDLFPKANFADGLSILEKLGHSKRMQIMRKEWIYEGQSRRSRESLEDDETARGKDVLDTEGGTARTVPGSDGPRNSIGAQHDERPENATGADRPRAAGINQRKDRSQEREADDLFLTDEEGAEPDEDELDELLAKAPAEFPQREEPEDDDLDALLAEESSRKDSSKPIARSNCRPADYDDDMEAMAGMDDRW